MSFDPANHKAKKHALATLEQVCATNDIWNKDVTAHAESLMELRRHTSKDVIKSVEDYVNSLANTPKSFDKSISEYKAAFDSFQHVLEEIKKESISTNRKSIGMGGSAIAAGAGIAALAPSAAMAIATTFGTASTGVAISSLSGAAATSAALAWLGGGALAVGGGGMAAGSGFLALAGPVGWAIGGTLLAGAGVYAANQNAKIVKEAQGHTYKVQVQNKTLKAAKIEIDRLLDLTKRHAQEVENLLNTLQKSAPTDYHAFTEIQRNQIGALINHIQALSKLLNQKVKG